MPEGDATIKTTVVGAREALSEIERLRSELDKLNASPGRSGTTGAGGFSGSAAPAGGAGFAPMAPTPGATSGTTGGMTPGAGGGWSPSGTAGFVPAAPIPYTGMTAYGGPAAPLPMPASGGAGGFGGMGGYGANILGNFTGGSFNPGGAMGAAVMGLPEALGMGGLAAGAAGAAYGLGRHILAGETILSEGPYRTESEVLAARAAGSPMQPYQEHHVTVNARARAVLDYYNHWTSSVSDVPAIRDRRQRMERALAESEGRYVATGRTGQITAYGGNVTGANLEAIESIAHQFGGMGSGVFGPLASLNYQELMNRMKITAGEAVGSVAPIGQYAQMPGNTDIAGMFRTRDLGGASSLTAERAALSGDFATLTAMRPRLTQGESDRLANIAWQAIELQGQSQMGMAQSSSAQSRLGYIRQSGGGIDSISGGYGDVIGTLQQRRSVAQQEADRPNLSPLERAQKQAEVDALTTQIVNTRHERSGEYFGYASAGAGVTSALAGAAVTRAGLFGGPAASQEAALSQVGGIVQQIKAINDYLARGNVAVTEQLQLQRQIVDLRSQEVSITERAYRSSAQQEVGVASGRLGIASTQYGTSIMMGAGGPAAQRGLFGIADQAGIVANRANSYVELLKSRGVSEDNPEMISARQQLATAQQGQAGADIATAGAPPTLEVQRGLSQSRYQAQVLSMMPGAYGSIRAAYGHQVEFVEQAAKQKQEEYAAAKAHYGGRLPDYLEFAFQQQFQDLGIQQASAFQQLSHGWESRLVSQTLGTPGNFGFISNQFTLRDAIQNGVVNPHMGSNGASLPFFLRQAAANYGPSAQGATGTPGGFALTAMTGARGGDFGDISGIPGFVGGTASPMPGETVVRVILQWPDGSQAGDVTQRVSGRSLGAREDQAGVNSMIHSNILHN